MPEAPADGPNRRDQLPGPRRPSDPRGAVRREVVLIRNYDHQWAYDVEIVARDETGEPVFERRYYLQPGGTASEPGELPPGTYEFTVTMDNDARDVLRCRIDETPERTVLVELGNGTMSVTAGPFS